MQKIDWEIVVQKYGKSVWQSAYRILGNSADAADCFQETFLSAYEISREQKVNNFRPFLFSNVNPDVTSGLPRPR